MANARRTALPNLPKIPMAGRSRTNPQIKARADAYLASAQRAIGELTSYGSGEPDRSEAIEMWEQLERMRLRLRGGRRA